MTLVDKLSKALESLDDFNKSVSESDLDRNTLESLQETLLRYADRSGYHNSHLQAVLVQSAPITMGCWITTMWGPAVVTNFEVKGAFTPTPTPGCWVHYRYRAGRDGKTLWVGNSDRMPWVHYLREPDDLSACVLTLKGPYGDE
jgi:hypothetical protein